MKTKHTKGILANNGLEIRSESNMIIANVYKHLEINQSKEEAESNAKRIVKCWNMHEEMLKALKLAATTIRTWHGESSWNLFEKSPEMQFINDAIKKAEL